MNILHQLESSAQRFETPCGTGRMVWRVWNRGAGAPLVLFHGGSGSWRHWVKQIAVFAAERMVVAPDLPGLGESDDPPEPALPETLGAIVADGMRQVAGDPAGIDVVGFSFGSIVAGHVAARLAPHLRSVTISGAGALGTPRSPTQLMKVRDKQGEERVAAHRFNLASLMFADPARIDDLALRIQDINSEGARLRSRQFAPGGTLRDALAAAAGVPLMAIWGERDAVTIGNLPERIAKLREVRPDAEVHIIPGAGHWVAYEAAEEVNTLLRRWLQPARAMAGPGAAA